MNWLNGYAHDDTAPAADPAPEPDAGGAGPRHVVCAPAVGAFYTGAEPGAEPFVVVGDRVRAGQQVAVVEAMARLDPVEADRDGRVVEVLTGDGEPVDYGQPLFVLAVTD